MKGTNRKFVVKAELLVTLIVASSLFVLVAQAQSVTTFSSADRFNIPNLNGSIQFATNGSYTSANFENNTWVFTGLKLNRLVTFGTIKISTLNSNITILSYRISNATTGRGQSITYYANAPGQQIIDLGLNSTQSNPLQWSVIVSQNVFLAKDSGWTFGPDNSFIVTGQTGNISITRFNFTNRFDDSNQPFLIRHSIIIITCALLAAVTAVAVILYLRRRA
jgi:hypothetical protein